MAKLPEERPADINLEDLLRLKRSERPTAEFWNDFDRDLHQRMLQTLVKKDPWYLQVLRGFSGRISQSIAVAAAAAVVALVVLRPAFQPVVAPASVAIAQAPVVVAAQAPVVEAVHAPVVVAAQAPVVEAVHAPVAVAMAQLSLAELADLNSVPNYHADVISADEAADDVNFVRDFGMESMQVASYEASAYSVDAANARVSFASTGVANLVY
ncbi:MAG: hypothetical protein ACI8Z5_000617 [Lentimonas sp.]|jgi:hypothetical protein